MIDHSRFRLVRVVPVALRWADMDAQGHVNNVQYFRYMEQARIEWLDATGCRGDAGVYGPVVKTAGCTFQRALVYPAEIEVRMYCAPPGRSSFMTRYTLTARGDQSTLYAEGEALVVWVDHAIGRSVPLPAQLRAHLPEAD